ncbi:hypothetical protein MNBD_ALPHA04-1828 [hydrothermal vent metagenome]|uniref:Ice-binding protein C-terminal domain-containing protein n=1 Tax=hydrothermal vent metagenome TaxID=652676 RepID=A0A3B0SZG8_9ZZZZ
MKVTGKLAGAVLAATMTIAAPSAANAAHTIVFDGTSGTFSNESIAVGAFSDTFTFSVVLPGNLASTVSSVLGSQMSNIDFTSVTLNGIDFDILASGAVEFRQVLNLAAGTNPQTLIVSGISGGNGSYAGTLAFASVPEPATWGMLIFGFGAIGGAMRRRRNVTTKVSYA